jgi:prepilin-type N-terminal cleavage/methylation domain-containing protein
MVRRAFTIIELTVTLCVLSLLTAIAIPWAGDVLDRARVRGAATDIGSLFGAARHIAIARAAHATVEIDTVGRVIAVSVGRDTVRKREIGSAHDVLLSATRTRMSYAANGVGYGAANLSVVVRRNRAVDTVFVSRLGRVRH